MGLLQSGGKCVVASGHANRADAGRLMFFRLDEEGGASEAQLFFNSFIRKVVSAKESA
jgi:hypothetical protein